MIPLSFSKLRNALCPFRFKMLYLDKAFLEPASDIMLIGRDLADALAEYREHCHAYGLVEDREFFRSKKWSWHNPAAMGELLANFLQSPAHIVPAPGDYDWHGIEMRLAFDAGLEPLDLGQHGWDNSPEIAFRLVVDYAYLQRGTLWIIDDKGGWGEPDPTQLELYAALLPRHLRQLGLEPREIKVLFNKVALKKIEVVGEYEPGGADHVATRLLARMAEIHGWTSHPHVVGDLCPLCSIPACPSRQFVEQELARKEGVMADVPYMVTSEAEARQAVEFLVQAEKVLGDVKTSLREYVEKHGPMVAAGKVADIRDEESWEPGDLPKVVGTLARLGVSQVEIWQALGLTKSSLEALLRKNKLKDRLPLVKSMGLSKITRKFGLFKPSTVARKAL